MKKRVFIIFSVFMLMSSFFMGTGMGEGPRGPLTDPFRPSVENHIWFWWPEGIAGFEFDDDGNLLYIVDGVPSQYGELISPSVQAEFQLLPFSGQFIYWHPIRVGGLGGFWLKHFAVKKIERSGGTVGPGVDYTYYLKAGKHMSEATPGDFTSYKDHPFESCPDNYLWKEMGSQLYGIEFDSRGAARYIVHGLPGTYSLNDVPSAQYTTWYPRDSTKKEGYWLKHIAIKEFWMSWGKVIPGVDLRFTAQYNLKDLTRKDAKDFAAVPFAFSLENHVWKEKGNRIYGFEFDEKGKILYMIEGVPGMFSLDDVPFSGEYTTWYPESPSHHTGFWLKYMAVKDIEQPWGAVEPGIDYEYEGGFSIRDLPRSSQFSFPFSAGPFDEIWKREGEELYGAQFGEDGMVRYLIHGIPGTYSLNEVPLSGEYVVWFPLQHGSEDGFWLKYVSIHEHEMDWGRVTRGVDLSYYQKDGHGISYLTRDHYWEGWDIGKIIKYFWDRFQS